MALLGLMLVTSVLSQVISNTAKAVQLAPVALEMGARLGLGAEPLLLGVTIASSTAFATPVALPGQCVGPGTGRLSVHAAAGGLVLVLRSDLASGELVLGAPRSESLSSPRYK